MDGLNVTVKVTIGSLNILVKLERLLLGER